MKHDLKKELETLAKSNGIVKELLAVLSEKTRTNTRPKLMKRHEVAEFLGISLVQVDRLANAGMLKKLHIGKGTTRYNEEDVINFALNLEI